MNKAAHHTFETAEQFHAWLRVNHASETELWVRIFKKATGQPSVTWDDCVVAAITWRRQRPRAATGAGRAPTPAPQPW